MLKEYLLETQKEIKMAVSPWAGSVFEDMISFSVDKRGELGEKWFSAWINKSNIEIQEDITTQTVKENGHYDMLANEKRLEIKTAYKGSSNSWQHENIYRENKCDLNFFLDIDYDCIYLSMVKREEIPFEYNDFFGARKRATLRAGKTDGYKFDFSKTQINLLKKKNRLLKIDPEKTTEKDIVDFLERMLRE